MTIQTNLSTLGAIQVPPSVLRTFCHLLDHYQPCSQKPVDDNDPTSIVPIIKSITQLSIINATQVETLLEQSKFCIGVELAFQELALELGVELDDTDHAYLSHWKVVQDFMKKSTTNKGLN